MNRMLTIGIILVAAVAALLYFMSGSNRSNSLILFGSVEVQEVRLGSKIGGRVAEVLVREGDHVKKGDELVRFDIPEIIAQRDQWSARLKQAEAQLAKAHAGPREEEKQAAWAAAKSADARARMSIKGFRKEEVERAKAEMDAARADVDLASREWKRIEELAKTRNATKTEYDTAKAGLDRSTSRLDSAKIYLGMMQTGLREEERESASWEAKRLESLAKLLDKGTRSEDLTAAQYAAMEAAAKVHELETSTKEGVVTAPANARIEVIAVRSGDLAGPNQPILRVLLADDLWVKAYVAETDLGWVKVGAKVEVVVDSHPGRRFAGEVAYIAGVSEFTPRNIQSPDQRKNQVFGVKVRVSNSEDVFKAGMAATVFVPR